MRQKIFIRIIFIFAGLLFGGCMDDTQSDNTDFELKEGDRLPSFRIEKNDGDTIATNDLYGKISVIMLFNTSCPDCRQEIPRMQEVYNWYYEHPEVEFLCISRAEERLSVEKFWTENNITLPFSPQSTTDVFKLFADYTIPRIYVADKTLVIRAAFNDNPIATAEDIIRNIDELLKYDVFGMLRQTP
ncbi:MAG: TlpA family protein disulfide reductase [Bacteroides sp.]|nr:TlpA family protein disulfide reductase [Roseburia sp.]MCM1347104.1 TlpA family protein disulfide reductase [Bacteroides sp.]MCM1420715.1 TlpA family protein disulfide reductase [Bacteroides sp.]